MFGLCSAFLSGLLCVRVCVSAFISIKCKSRLGFFPLNAAWPRDRVDSSSGNSSHGTWTGSWSGLVGGWRVAEIVECFSRIAAFCFPAEAVPRPSLRFSSLRLYIFYVTPPPLCMPLISHGQQPKTSHIALRKPLIINEYLPWHRSQLLRV